MENKGFSLISILIAVGILAVVVGGGYYYTQNSQIDENRIYMANSVEECSVIDYVCEEGWDYFSNETGCGCELSANEEALDEEEEIGDSIEGQSGDTDKVLNEISDWKIYRNNEYGFEFRYPEDFIKKDSYENYFFAEKHDGEIGYYISVRLRENSQVEDSFSFNGRKAHQYYFYEGAGYTSVFQLQLDNDILEVTYDMIGGKNKEVVVKNNFDKILSTFKFTK